LGLKAVEARLEGLLEQAAKKEPSYGDFLDEVLACEVDARRSRQQGLLVGRAYGGYIVVGVRFQFLQVGFR